MNKKRIHVSDTRVHDITYTLITHEIKTNIVHQIDVYLLHKFPLELGGYYNTGVRLRNVYRTRNKYVHFTYPII